MHSVQCALCTPASMHHTLPITSLPNTSIPIYPVHVKSRIVLMHAIISYLLNTQHDWRMTWYKHHHIMILNNAKLCWYVWLFECWNFTLKKKTLLSFSFWNSTYAFCINGGFYYNFVKIFGTQILMKIP